MLMNWGARSHVYVGPWVRDSIACHAVCSNPASRLLGLQPQPAWGDSARLHEFMFLPEKARGGKMLFVQRVMSVNQLMELTVEVWFLRSLELCEPVFNSDRTWQVESPLVMPRKEHKNWTCTTKPCKHKAHPHHRDSMPFWGIVYLKYRPFWHVVIFI